MGDQVLTVVFLPVEEGWVQARIAELPAVITVGRDKAEARSLIEDALREYLLSLSGNETTDVAGESERVSLVLRPAS